MESPEDTIEQCRLNKVSLAVYKQYHRDPHRSCTAAVYNVSRISLHNSVRVFVQTCQSSFTQAHIEAFSVSAASHAVHKVEWPWAGAADQLFTASSSNKHLSS